MNKFLSLRGINIWMLIAAVLLNLFWSVLVVFLSSAIIFNSGNVPEDVAITPWIPFIQAGLLLAYYSGSLLVGFLAGKMSPDGRGPTYGMYGALGAWLPILFIFLPAGLIGLLMIVSTVLGGFSGGILSMRPPRHD